MAISTSSLSGLTIKRMDHLGLVSGMCRELGIAKMIDAVIPKNNEHKVTHGEAFVAMLLNGLGFHSRTLHMFADFFADKPTERLIGPGVQAKHLNDDVLGRCLDALYEADVSSLYQVMAERVVDTLGLASNAVHLDITSFHVDGEYAVDEQDSETKRIELVKGYSRDHRPELNQVILELICENQAGIPVYMQALSGNTNDQKAFAEVTRHHIQCLKAAQQCRYFVADAALYTEESITALATQNQLFISRVPMTIKDARQHVSNVTEASLTAMGNGYHGCWVDADYAGVKQKWLILRSEQATKREQQTLARNLLKSSEKEHKQFIKLCKQRFACQTDAETAMKVFSKTLKTTRISEFDCIAHPVFLGKGRPKKGQQPAYYEYQLDGLIATCLDKVGIAQAQTGMFILATNDCSGKLSMQTLLDTYKSQQQVERGFRFLKSPEFLTSSLFLKKPERIEALLMVMTCSLMIYAALEHRIRTSLKERQQYFPDMKKKPSQKPTARWVFLCFSGIHEVSIGDSPPVITDKQERQQVIIDVLGTLYQEIYS